MTDPVPATAHDSESGPSDAFVGPGWAEHGVATTEPTTGADGRPRGRRVRVSRRKRRRRRRIALVMMMFGGLILVAGAWLAVTGFMARSQLAVARTEVHQLRAQIAAGDLHAARVTASDLAKHAHRAHQLTTGPAWAVAAALPAGGEPLRTIRGITAGVDSLGREVLPALVTASEQLDPATLRRPDGSVDLARLTAVGPALTQASARMTDVSRVVGALPHNTWLSTIDSARTDVAAQLVALGKTVRSADLSARILPPMLGQDGPKRYFVAFQNESEARGTGGLPGAFAIAEANRGQLSFTRFESDAVLFGTSADVEFGRAYHQLYDGAGTTTLYGNANLSPNFPYAAQIWASMWQRKSGQRVDGVIAVDPTTLSYLLAVTGPVTLPDHSAVNSGNVVALTQSTVYTKFATDNDARRRFLLDVARTVSRKIIDTHADTTALVRGASKAAGQRRLLVWSADPRVQADLAQTSVSGIIPTTSAPYVGLSIVNDGGNKLDYYLDRSLTWQRTGCGSTRKSTVTITLTNNAPASGLSPYVTGRSDAHSYAIKVGDNRLLVSYLATTGALMDGVTINGKAATASIGSEHGHPVYTIDLELPRGSPRTIVLRLSEPSGTGAPIVLRQPLVRPLQITLNDAHCD